MLMVTLPRVRHYGFADCSIACNIALPELRSAVGRHDLHICVCFHGADHEIELPGSWEIVDVDCGLMVGKRADSTTLRFPELADFVVSSAGTRVDVVAERGTDFATVRHLLLDQVLPRVLSLRSGSVLHAAVVATNTNAFCIAGRTGRGKSTLAAACERSGATLWSDDGARLSAATGTSITVVPTYTGLRLLEDSLHQVVGGMEGTERMAQYSAKRRVVRTPIQYGDALPLRLRAIYSLAEPMGAGDSGVVITLLSPSLSTMTVLANSFLLNPADTRLAAAALQQAGRVARLVPVFELRYPRDYERLADVADALLRHAASVPKSHLAASR